MRAAVANPGLASVLGVNVRFVYSISWFMAGGLAGVAGAFYTLWFQGSPDAAFSLLVSAFSGSVLGGLLNIYGAFFGGYFVGLTEILGTTLAASIVGPWITAYRPAIPLALIAITLLIIPRGITSISWRALLDRAHRRRI
jgi:branched-chain amino acid transport system permease protein